jgi:alpha-glucosidase
VSLSFRTRPEKTGQLALVDEPHHDGSPGYVDSTPRVLGSTVRVRLRVPDACGSTRVRLRSTPDAEPAVVEATIERHELGAAWWSADLALHNPVTAYRWLLDGGPLGRCWVNGAGVLHRDVTDDADFRITTTPAPPDWLADTVGYQIFIDRFADSGVPRPTPEWAIPRAWDEPVDDTAGIRSRHWYGGDLAGIQHHLDHLTHLGVSLIYLTPFFPAGSMHRYDASTFDHVDPALGGDDALASLVAAAHARGIRVIGDITLNHTGVHHDWFRAATDEPDSVERALLLLRRVRALRLRGVARRPLAAEARPPQYGTARASVRRRRLGGRPVPRRTVRARRLAGGLREHHSAVPRPRPQPCRCPHHPRDDGGARGRR